MTGQSFLILVGRRPKVLIKGDLNLRKIDRKRKVLRLPAVGYRAARLHFAGSAATRLFVAIGLAGYAELGIRQSIFSPAARRERLREQENAERRDGELKMDWTNTPDDSPAYGHWMVGRGLRGADRRPRRESLSGLRREQGAGWIDWRGAVEGEWCGSMTIGSRRDKASPSAGAAGLGE